MAFNQYAKTERDFTTLLNSANMTPADRDKLSAVLASLVGFQATQPGTNQTLEEQIANIDEDISSIETQIGDIVAAINNIKVPVWKMQVFDANGTFTVPESIAGSVVYVTGSGGGGSGQAIAFPSSSSQQASAGNAGCYIEKRPVQVTAGDAIPVIIGAGGAAVTATGGASTTVVTNGLNGGSTSFGSLVISGGGVGIEQGGGWVSGGLIGGVNTQAQNSISHVAGRRVQNGNAIAFGSAGGAFGSGVDGVATADVDAVGLSPVANSGAGGGAAAVRVGGSNKTATSGAGGSGKIIVEWQEFA